MKYRTLKAYAEALGYEVNIDEWMYIELDKNITINTLPKQSWGYHLIVVASFENETMDFDGEITIEWMEFDSDGTVLARQIEHMVDIIKKAEAEFREAGCKFADDYYNIPLMEVK